MYQAVKNALEIIKKDLLGWLNMTGAQWMPIEIPYFPVKESEIPYTGFSVDDNVYVCYDKSSDRLVSFSSIYLFLWLIQTI
jgi:hypothetical protein